MPSSSRSAYVLPYHHLHPLASLRQHDKSLVPYESLAHGRNVADLASEQYEVET
jgi:hypothetical protein